jgi:endonuclease III
MDCLKLNQLILTQDKKLKEIVDHDERAQLLKTLPGVGRHTNVVVVALANKLTRITWSVLSTKQAFEVRVQT